MKRETLYFKFLHCLQPDHQPPNSLTNTVPVGSPSQLLSNTPAGGPGKNREFSALVLQQIPEGMECLI